MTNIWGFLLQTLSVGIVILLLLAIKRVFADKLSPRFQYLLWGVLALRVLTPASLYRTVLIPFGLELETAKSMAEAFLSSAYSSSLEPISMTSVFPVITERPESVTDMLFAVYAAGVVLFLLYYLITYIRLRVLLSRAENISPKTAEKIEAVCKKYELKSCRAVTVSGISSAFVCGIIRPILVLPSEGETDEKVILHELLHLKYKDALQNVGWCLLRVLHWCNPLVHYAVYRIACDMESLCDQRVLERLCGEERREYGKILLDMANDRYARTPFTTSISNGGKNISRRIDAIVRFKKYPKGIMTAAVCMAVFLVFPTVIGTKPVYADSLYPAKDYYGNITDEDALYGTPWKEAKMRSLIRINRCETLAGALDTYAKGLIYQNGYYIATASPLSRYEEMVENLENPIEWCFEEMDLRFYSKYWILNLTEIDEERYEAILVFSINDYLVGETFYSAVTVPVVAYRDEGVWVVEETGERMLSGENAQADVLFLVAGAAVGDWSRASYPFAERYEYEMETGKIDVCIRTVHTVGKNDSIFAVTGGTAVNESLNLDAEFYAKNIIPIWVYTHDETCGKAPSRLLSLCVRRLDSADEDYRFEGEKYVSNAGGWSIGSSETGETLSVGANWNGVMSVSEYLTGEGLRTEMWDTYAMRIYFDGELVSEFIVTEDDHVTIVE